MKKFLAVITIVISSLLCQAQGPPPPVGLFWTPDRDKGGFTQWGRTATAGGFFNFRINSGGNVLPPGIVQLPLVWEDPHECDAAFTYEMRFPNTWVSSVPPTGFINFPYANTQAGLQLAINDMESFRTSSGLGIQVDVPAGTLYSGPGLVIPQTSLVASATCLNLISTQDSHLPDGTIVCERGMQDNLPTSTDVWINNPSCTSPNDVQWMWTVEAALSNNSTIKACSPAPTGSEPQCGSNLLAPDHWMISGVEARPLAGLNGNFTPIDFAIGGNASSTSQLPNHIHLKKSWAHGDWTSLTTTSTSGHNSITNDITWGVIGGTIEDTFTGESLRPKSEGHGLGMNYGSQNNIVHNVFEGQSSGIFCGGFAGQMLIANYVVCQDMVVRRNRFTFPASWLGVLTLPPSTTWPCNPTCASIARKNTSELKQAKRFLWAGNIGENSDQSGGQNGIVGLSMTVRDTSGGGVSANYTNTIQDVTYEDSIGRNGCSDASLAAQSGLGLNGGGIATPMRNINWRNFIYYNITRNNPGCSTASTTHFAIASVIYNWQATVQRDATGTIATATAICTNMVSGNCPAGPPPVGFEQISTDVSEPLAMQNCTDPSFNTPTDSSTWGGQVVPGLGVLALPGTLVNGLIAVYPSIGTANAQDTSTTCTLSVQGWPKNFFITHGTFISDAVRGMGGGNGFSTVGSGPMYGVNSLLRDTIFISGGFTTSAAEGTASEKFLWDFTTFTTDHVVWVGRTASKYTDYGNNLLFPGTCLVTGGCSANSANFPAIANCTGDPASSPTCVAFRGMLGTSVVNLNLSDYHLYTLCTASDAVCSNKASIFSAGQSNQASDGTAVGFDPVAIDSAQTIHKYVCKTQCGPPPGPYQD